MAARQAGREGRKRRDAEAAGEERAPATATRTAVPVLDAALVAGAAAGDARSAAVLTATGGAVVQAKLAVGRADDPWEHAADAAADAALRRLAGAGPELGPPSAAGGAGDPDAERGDAGPAAPARLATTAGAATARRAAAGPDARGGGDTTPAEERAIRAGGGGRLDGRTQARMEHAFGTDLSDVRVHDDSRAHQLAGGLQATAFTAGSGIWFAEGAYDPGSARGERVLAHELAHVVQQRGGGAAPVRRIGVMTVADWKDDPVGAFEQDSSVSIPLDFIDLADTIHKSTMASSDLSAKEFGELESFGGDGYGETTGALGVASGLASMASGGVEGAKGIAKVVKNERGSFGHNLGAQEIESGLWSLGGGGTGAASSLASAIGESVPGLDVATNLVTAAEKFKTGTEDAVTSAKLGRRRTHLKRAQDQYLPDSERLKRFQEFWKSEGARFAADDAAKQGKAATKTAATALGGAKDAHAKVLATAKADADKAAKAVMDAADQAAQKAEADASKAGKTREQALEAARVAAQKAMDDVVAATKKEKEALASQKADQGAADKAAAAASKAAAAQAMKDALAAKKSKADAQAAAKAAGDKALADEMAKHKAKIDANTTAVTAATKAKADAIAARDKAKAKVDDDRAADKKARSDDATSRKTAAAKAKTDAATAADTARKARGADVQKAEADISKAQSDRTKAKGDVSAAGKARKAATSGLKRGEHARFVKLRDEFGSFDATNPKPFLDWLRTQAEAKSGYHDFGYGTDVRNQFKASGAAGAGDEYTKLGKLKEFAKFGQGRKAETATLNMIEGTGAALDAAGTLTAGSDFGATKITGKTLKGGAAAYRALKSGGKRAKRVHQLRKARNEIGYGKAPTGGKAPKERSVMWGAKMFFGGNIEASQAKTAKAIKGTPAGAKKANKAIAAGDRERLLKMVTTKCLRQINTFIDCLCSPSKAVQTQAEKILHIIAETNLAGALAKIDAAHIASFRALANKSPRTADEEKRYKKERGHLKGILTKHLEGIGG
ncbi:MAG: DUF4157 domain-containing protein [Acidimicrobiia bacterium]